MLNISEKRIDSYIDKDKYSAFELLRNKSVSSALIRLGAFLFILAFVFLFLPWTQNIRAKGYVTTLNPDQRPQDVQSLIAGKIEKWYVQEGDFVQQGDTIMQISEVKEEYLDPQILERTRGQIDAKTGSVAAYVDKAQSLDQQIVALIKGREAKLEQNDIKIEQTKLKIQSDSMERIAENAKLDIAIFQLERMEKMYDAGLKSLTDLEAKRLSVQQSRAKVTAITNKIDANRNELENLTTNRITIINSYADKIAKSQSDRASAVSSRFDTEASINKLQSSYNAYEQRQLNYFIKSPITGYITKAIKTGIGEIIKNGDGIITIMPGDYQLAVEMYVDPVDVPLLKRGQKVRVQFDGWPAIVFSGWPNSSYGTFGGRVFAIDNFISDNNKYRVLVEQDPEESPWPEPVRVGGGANTITLLNDVKIGYEIWRQLNGFPPDYYRDQKSEDVKTKAPLRKVK